MTCMYLNFGVRARRLLVGDENVLDGRRLGWFCGLFLFELLVFVVVSITTYSIVAPLLMDAFLLYSGKYSQSLTKSSPYILRLSLSDSLVHLFYSILFPVTYCGFLMLALLSPF